MPITEKQREERRKHIGGSDVPAIMGLDPWRNAFDIWLAKTGKLEPQDESESMPLKIGRLFEDGLLAYAAEELGPLRKNVYRSAPELPIASHIDAVLQLIPIPVEAKMTTNAHSTEVWGVGGTDAVPDRVIVQCHAHMICMDKENPQKCYCPHFDPWHGLQIYEVNRNEELVNMISEVTLDFWNNHVLKDVPPMGQPTLPVARIMRRVPGKVKAFSEEEIEWVKEWYAAKNLLAAAKKKEDERKAKVLAILEDSESCEPIEGSEPIPEFGQVTYLSQSRGKFDDKLLQAEEPVMHDKYNGTISFRVLRVKKPNKKEMKALQSV